MVEAATKSSFPPEATATMSPRELILNNVETERLVDDLDINSVLSEHQLIEPTHAEELSDSMRTSVRGQISAIVVRARIDEVTGNVVHDVIDGFHRTEAKRKNGDQTIKANVLYGCSDEEMNDLRILAASSVRSVKFARQIKWINDSFADTPWAAKGLKAHQAFGIAMNNTFRSNNADLSPDEITEIKEWVKSKAVRWEKSVNTVYQELRLAAQAAPDLVERVRTASGGTERETTITQAKLATVVNAFPGESFHDLQRVVLNFAVDKKLKIDQIKQIVNTIQIHEGTNQEEFLRLVSDAYEATKIIEKNTLSFPAENTPTDIFNDEDTMNEVSSTQEIPDIDVKDDDLMLEADEPPDDLIFALEKGETTTKTARPETHIIYHEDNGDASMRTGDYERGERITIATLKEKIADLEQALVTANANNGNGNGTHQEKWWETAPYLTSLERTGMDAFYGFRSLAQLAENTRITQNELLLNIRSAIAKHRNADKSGKLMFDYSE